MSHDYSIPFIFMMITDERRTRILQIAEESGFVSLQRLVSAVGASESTVRRDLEFLDAQGHLHRTRGGAAYAGDSLADFDVRQNRASLEKRRIAQRTAELISEGETVLLDGGTTTLEVAKNLNGKTLQVVTNSLPIASQLMNQPKVELIFIGGYVYPKTGVALGDQAISALKNINVSRLVMSAGGVTQDGLFNSNALLVETERQMISAAGRVTLVADSSKFGQRALSQLCPLSAVSEIVTDDALSEEWKQTLESAGIALDVVDVVDVKSRTMVES
ncbi:MAG: DeoR/GlpR family DNA-binding transcription regulator [Fuerstiella sp.]|nr:DeoR/GlpR family DNA-binding transcription regulator [Fuerstiella sp.]